MGTGQFNLTGVVLKVQEFLIRRLLLSFAVASFIDQCCFGSRKSFSTTAFIFSSQCLLTTENYFATGGDFFSHS
jgi:hypothetical protein